MNAEAPKIDQPTDYAVATVVDTVTSELGVDPLWAFTNAQGEAPIGSPEQRGHALARQLSAHVLHREGCSYREIAAGLGYQPNSVANVLREASYALKHSSRNRKIVNLAMERLVDAHE